jgi:hypothetical protein
MPLHQATNGCLMQRHPRAPLVNVRPMMQRTNGSRAQINWGGRV